MISHFDNYNGDDWEEFCENMLRHHYGQRNFYKVPAKDSGDLGIEFFTSCGTIYQCYMPDLSYEMSEWKRKVQSKINADLKKLDRYNVDIKKLLNGIIIDQWILLTPRFDSKDLISYCNKKRNEVVKKDLSFIDNDDLVVKIETDTIFPKSRLFALSVQSVAVNIPIPYVSSEQKDTWAEGNTIFAKNIDRKSKILAKKGRDKFKQTVVEKYIQVDSFLDSLRNDYPDLCDSLEDSARAQLANVEEEAVMQGEVDHSFSNYIRTSNKQHFQKHQKHFSPSNYQILSFGYMSKWLAECNLDFLYEETDEDKS